MGKNKDEQSYKILQRFRIRQNGRDVHCYEVEYEDGSTGVLPGFFAYAYQDEDEPCIYCGNSPRKRLRKMCEECISRGADS